jgi:hypothetical protein
LLAPALQDDKRDPLSRSVTEAFNTVFGLTQTGAMVVQPTDQSEDSPLRAFLSGHSAIWGFARAVKRRLSAKPPASVLSTDFHTAVASLTPQALDYATVFESEGWRTILTPGYRHAVENEKDTRIQAGFWLTQWAIKDIAGAAAENGATAIFVLIPTKESVFAGRLAQPPALETLNQLTAEENRFREKLMNFMDVNGLKYIDVLPALRSLSRQPYFENIDGHPNAAGQAAIASSLSGLVAPCGR